MKYISLVVLIVLQSSLRGLELASNSNFKLNKDEIYERELRFKNSLPTKVSFSIKTPIDLC